MNKIGRCTSILIHVFLGVVAASLSTSLLAKSFFEKSDFTYLGAFRVPTDGGGESSFSYGGTAPAFNPNGNGGQGSLFIVGQAHHQMIAEISIPSPVASEDIASLKTAKFIQPFFDVKSRIPQQGNMLPLGVFSAGRGGIGGLLLHDQSLIGSVYTYYDAGADSRKRDSHFVIEQASDMANSSVTGFHNVGLDQGAGGLTGGWMTRVPSNWTARLRKPYLTGLCCISVIGRSSYGPSAFAFDPAEFNGPAPNSTKVIPYLRYRDKELGTYGEDWSWTLDGNQWVGTTGIGGMVSPENSDSLIYIGGTGLGPYCYGIGSDDQAQHNLTDDSDGRHWCYDPTNKNKGGHAWPYTSLVYLYDLNDFLTEFLPIGARRPYAVFALPDFPTDLRGAPAKIGGTAYDSKSGRIYITQRGADRIGCCGSYPLVHVYQLNINNNPSPTNRAPYVNPGEQKTVRFPNTIQLFGLVTDDGLPRSSSLNVSWAKVSGPGVVTFDDQTLSFPTVSFDRPGQYVLSLTASDSELEQTRSVKVVVTESD